MSGFQKSALNRVYKEQLFTRIIGAIVKSCELMIRDCMEGNYFLDNHEEKIRTYLVENYLDHDGKRKDVGLQGIDIRLEIEIPENYNPATISYTGRTDVRIVLGDWFSNRNAYYQDLELKHIFYDMSDIIL